LGDAGLVVRSLDAVLPYRDGLTPIDSLSRRLDVNWVVGGQLYRRADSTVATAGLTDAASGRRIDGTEARAAFGDDVRLIEELVPKVAALLRTRVGDQVRVEGWRAGTRSDRAFSAVNWAHKERREAKQLMARNDIPGAQLHLRRADSALETAARADARWIEPLIQRALVALTYARSAFASGRSADFARAALQRGKAHALAALRLDGKSPRALEAVGMLLHEESGLIPGSDSSRVLRDSAERVLTLASNVDTTLVEAASLLSTAHFGRGEYDQAYVMAERAYAADAYYRDPHEVLSMLFTYSFEDEEDADARRWCAAYGAMFPEDWYAGQCRLTLMIWDSRESPNADSAWAVARAAIAAAPEVIRPAVRVQVQTLLAGALARAGAPSNARRVLAEVDAAIRANPGIAREPFGADLLEIQAAVRLRMGQTDSATVLIRELLRREPDRGVRLQRSRRFRDVPFERWRDAVGPSR
jgi:tetratricopeptide (TPR) repeat protein